jgi:hypothetical protein
VFPAGAFAVAVEPVRDYDKSTKEVMVQARDDDGLLLWSVEILDADPSARASDRSVKVKVAAPVQPVLPEEMAGTPFRPVEFDGLWVRPYVNSSTGRLAYSFSAKGFHAPQVGVKAAAAGKSGAAA